MLSTGPGVPFSPSGASPVLVPAAHTEEPLGWWELGGDTIQNSGKEAWVNGEATQVPSPRTLKISPGAVVLRWEEEIRRLSHSVCSVQTPLMQPIPLG